MCIAMIFLSLCFLLYPAEAQKSNLPTAPHVTERLRE